MRDWTIINGAERYVIQADTDYEAYDKAEALYNAEHGQGAFDRLTIGIVKGDATVKGKVVR